jgi:prolyl oligopeptidase
VSLLLRALLDAIEWFADFCAVASHLHSTGVSTPALTGIQGGSNGGLLVLASSIQHPELFGAVISQVPVADMLRFHRFTIGSAWTTDYGNADASREELETLLKYSPLHNVREIPGDGQFPSTLVLTADHDDRVVPLHTYKMVATLQHVLGRAAKQTRPLLARIDVDAGHGAGKSLSMIIEEVADIYAFFSVELCEPSQP